MFTAVHISDTMEENNPAGVDLATGELYLNGNTFFSYPLNIRRMILLHELGHLKHNTRCEFTADEYAFINYTGKGLSLKDSVKSISETLSGNNPEHYARLYKRIEMAKKADNKNLTNYAGTGIAIEDPETGDILLPPDDYDKLEAQIDRQIQAIDVGINQDDNVIATYNNEILQIELELKRIESAILVQNNKIENECTHYNRKSREMDCRKLATNIVVRLFEKQNDLGADLSDKQNRKGERLRQRGVKQLAKQERLKLKAESRAYKRMTLADGKTYRRMARGDADYVRAMQGMPSSGTQMVSDIMGGLSSGLASIMGGGSPQGGAYYEEDNTMLYVGLAVLVVIAGAFFMLKKKKK